MQSFKEHRRFIITVITVFLFVLTACGQNEAPSVNDSPNTNGGQAASAKPNADWDKIVEAAKKEGKIIISGGASETNRTAAVEPFEKKYPEIKVEYVGLNGRDFWPRVQKERQFNQYNWDLRMGGVDQIGWEEAKKILVPIRPLLLPEVTEDSKWLGGFASSFVDKAGQYSPSFLAYTQSPITVNRDFISKEELKSPEQLLDPKFKGKIVINDPRGGAGLGEMTVLLSKYGEDFMTKLLSTQDVMVTSDGRQLVEWVVRGKYPIGMGVEKTVLQTLFQSQGLGKNVDTAMEEGPVGLFFGFGAVLHLDNAPHPNAARVYINWLLSKEGQIAQSEVLKLNSRRLDVPVANPTTVVDPKQMDRYVPNQEERYEPVRKQASQLAAKLIKQ